ncbi:MAG: adenosine deaminase [Pseudonocardia sp.]|nr:adenosine deaminase [Pseudonocardia sp.]
MAAPLTAETIRIAPKVLLHDHLDGGPRVSTVIELAEAAGYRGLPTTDPAELAAWFLGTGAGSRRSRWGGGHTAHSASLERYLETFGHTVAVMQTPEALSRVASEAAQDLAADGVVYAEIRFAPELHVENGLDLDTVVQAVLSGFRTGTEIAAAEGRTIRIGCLLTAMRHAARSREIAELSVRHRDGIDARSAGAPLGADARSAGAPLGGVVGFDIAGAEKGFPPTRHLDAFEYVRQQNAHVTIHAGEAFGLPSIWEAIQWCGADRLGHGMRIVDDIAVGDDPGEPPRLGRLAAYIRDMRVPLEMCPTSNVHTGAAPSLAEHPIGLLTRLRFRVTVNTDNRLMSACTMTSEMTDLVETFGYDWATLQWFTVNAMKSAFIGFDERLALINDVIKPGYAALTAD